MREVSPIFRSKLTSSLSLHNLITQTMVEQDAIGWDHFARGRISKFWTTTQTSQNKTQCIKRWQQQFITKIQKVNSTLWEVRNTLQFGKGKEKLTREQNRLVPTITNYYEIYHYTISTKYYKIFNTSLVQRLNYSPIENSQWINTVKAAQKFYNKRQQSFYQKKKHTKITQYLKHHEQTSTTANLSQDNNS